MVTTKARRGGLGARLLDAVAAEARAQGLTRLVLDTGLDNLLGQRFYFRYGMLPAALRFAVAVESRGRCGMTSSGLAPALPRHDEGGRAESAECAGSSGAPDQWWKMSGSS